MFGEEANAMEGNNGFGVNMTIPTAVTLRVLGSGEVRIEGVGVQITLNQAEVVSQNQPHALAPPGQQYAPLHQSGGTVQPPGNQHQARQRSESPSFSAGTFANIDWGIGQLAMPASPGGQQPQAHAPRHQPQDGSHEQNLQQFGLPLQPQNPTLPFGTFAMADLGMALPANPSGQAVVTQILAIPVDANGVVGEDVAQVVNPLLNQGVDYAPAHSITEQIKQLSLTSLLSEEHVNYLLTHDSIEVNIPTVEKSDHGLFMHPACFFKGFKQDKHATIKSRKGYGQFYTLVKFNLTYAVTDLLDESDPNFVIRRRRYKKIAQPNEPEPSKFLCHYLRVPATSRDEVLQSFA